MINNIHEFLNGAIAVGSLASLYFGMDYIKPLFNFIPTNNIQNVFDSTLKNVNVNIHNKNQDTFKIKKLKTMEQGAWGEVIIPYGLSMEQLENIIPMLEQHLNMTIKLTKNNKKFFIYFYNLNNRVDFIPCDNPHGVLTIGATHNNKPFNISLDKEPHLLLTGVTGTGKTTLLFTILTNLFYNYNNDYDIYLMQVINSELSILENCSGVKMCLNSLIECLGVLTRIEKELDRRMNLLRTTGAKNVNQYNKYNSKKLKRILIVIDEFSFFRIEETDDEQTKEIKINIESILLRIIKSGRSNNVNIISCLQRATTDNINTTIRSQIAFLSFKLKLNDSKLLFGDTRANELKPMQFLFNGQTGEEVLKSYYVDDDLKILQNYVKEIKIFNGASTKTEIIKEPKKDKIEIAKNRNKTILPPSIVIVKNGKVFIDGKEQIQEPKKELVKTQSYENKILNFIEKYSAISNVQCAKLFYKDNRNNSKRALKDLEEKGKVYKYMIDKYSIYGAAGATEIKNHELIRNDFIVNFLLLGHIEVLEIKKECKILNNMIRADLYIKYVKDKEIKHLYVEVDDTHYTNNKKLKLYEEQLKVHTFKLFIITKEVKQYKNFQYDIIPLQDKKYTLNI